MAKSIIWQGDGVRIVGDVEKLRALKVPLKEADVSAWPVLESATTDALGHNAWWDRPLAGAERAVVFELVKRCLEM